MQAHGLIHPRRVRRAAVLWPPPRRLRVGVEEAPLNDLRETINTYIHYVDARAGLIGKGWDVELPIEPQCRPTA